VPTQHYGGGKYNGLEYDHPEVVKQARTKDTTLSYDFMLLKTAVNFHSPTIVDTDGEIRWVGTADTITTSTIFYDNSLFTVKATVAGADGGGTGIVRNEFDGTVSDVADYASDGVTVFHHNLEFGKTGILAAVSTPAYMQSNVLEVDTAGNILHSWDLAQIITNAMIAGGDDPTKFVPASGSMVDWFHNNSNAYRPSDDTLLVSSRENFVIALDYETGAIKWIFGDHTKQWYEFPSLRKYALKAPAGSGTHYPIGQHALSIYRDKLLLFDDGLDSTTHTPAGKNLTYSAPRKYTIDAAAGTATEIWNYLADPAIYSPVTSSVYEDQPGSYLIDYAAGGPYLFAELIGLNPAGDKVFDYKYTEFFTAATAWNTVPIHLENLVFN
jgi:arylsulfate sulfotransferase